jgi:hypothetical protein
MLEIVILIVLAGKIGRIVESKGRKKIGYQLMLVGMWIGGELFGMVVGAIIGGMATGKEDGAVLVGVVGALACAITGAVIAFQIAKHLDPIGVEDEFYRGDDYSDTWRAREERRDREAADLPSTDAFTDNPEQPRRSQDDRIQP